MKLVALVLTMVWTAAPVFAQALIEYGGAMAPAATFAAHPANPAARIHPKEIGSQARDVRVHRLPANSGAQATNSGKRCDRIHATQATKAQCPRRTKDGKFAAGATASSNQEPKLGEPNGAEKKGSDAAAITIQR